MILLPPAFSRVALSNLLYLFIFIIYLNFALSLYLHRYSSILLLLPKRFQSGTPFSFPLCLLLPPSFLSFHCADSPLFLLFIFCHFRFSFQHVSFHQLVRIFSSWKSLALHGTSNFCTIRTPNLDVVICLCKSVSFRWKHMVHRDGTIRCRGHFEGTSPRVDYRRRHWRLVHSFTDLDARYQCPSKPCNSLLPTPY